jgi:selenium metabolism protein YedF
MREDLVLLLASDQLGQGDPELGALLMRSFLKTLVPAAQAPGAVLLLNGGVRLACEGSAVLPELQALAARGAAVLSCGTCLDFFHLREALRTGEVSNMADIVDRLTRATTVLRP